MRTVTTKPGLRWDFVAELGLPRPAGAWIDGKWMTVPGVGALVAEDPAAGVALGEVIDGGAALVDQAVASACRSYQDVWRHVIPASRARLLAGIGRRIAQEGDMLAQVECVDTGKPLAQAKADIATAARYFEYYAGLADKILGETLPQGEGALAYTVREPYGVVAHITPWNSPVTQMCRGVAPSLAAGNTVVVKPSELTPFSSLLVARLMTDCGLPDGVCNVVPGRGEAAGAALAGHPDVSHVSFTGSVATGRAVLEAAAAHIVPCTLELGGKSPTLIFADADLDAAARAGMAAMIRNSGQSCFATTRLLAQQDIYEELVSRLAAAAAQVTIGHGLDDPDLGPLVSASQRERVLGFVTEAAAAGARIAGRGPEIDDSQPGYFVSPTVLADVKNDMRIAQEEVFGPVQCVIPFAEEDEAIKLANDTRYGLAAGIFTRDLRRAHRVASRLEAGQVQINKYPIGGIDIPFGGYKHSGMGREKGGEALKHYTQLKSVVIDLA